MANCTCEKIGTAKLIFITVTVGSTYGNGLGALGNTVSTGVGKATLTLTLLTCIGNDLGIDKLVYPRHRQG